MNYIYFCAESEKVYVKKSKYWMNSYVGVYRANSQYFTSEKLNKNSIYNSFTI